MLRIAPLLLVLFCCTSCEEAGQVYGYFFNTLIEPEACDAGVNVYIGDTHFIERDYLEGDGTVDYDKWIRITDPTLSPCDPLRTPSREVRREEERVQWEMQRRARRAGQQSGQPADEPAAESAGF